MNDNLLVTKDASLNSKLFVNGNVSMNANLDVKGNVNIGRTDNCGNLLINGSIVPLQGSTWDLGSAQFPFKSLYVSNQTITLVGIKNDGNTTTTGISVDGGTLKLNTDAGSDQVVVMSVDNKTGLGKSSSLAAATLDVSGSVLISGDVSLNSKLIVMNDGLFNSKLSVANDVSLNKNVDISGNLVIRGNLSVFQQQSTSVINTTVNNYNVLSTKDISLNGNLVISGGATMNGRVDICGNLYAQYPVNSIPTTAIIDGVTLSYVDASLGLKAPINNPTFTGTVGGITKSMVGLGSVDNTSDLGKPISTATQSALDLKAAISYVDPSLNLKANLASPTFTGTVAGITKSMVGLGNVDNTSDLGKPISTATQSALDLKATTTNVDASLNLKANLASPTFTGTVGGITKSMVGLGNVDNTSDTSKPISTATQSALDLKATTTNVDVSLNLKANLASPTFTGTVGGITKSMVGLGSVDNTSDLGKPISTATQSALDLKAAISYVDPSLNLKANLASPIFTGTVTAAKLTSGDASFNGRVDISGVLSVTQTVNSVVKNTTVNNYNVSVTNDLSLNGNLLVSSDVSLNSKLFVTGDTSFNGRVDICGNFYAQYPASSIPSSAIIGGVGGGSGSGGGSSATDISVNSLTVGRGPGDVATNTAYGYQALLTNTTGANNTAIGYQAGDVNITGAFNTFLGAYADTNSSAWSRSTAIGANALITASNQIVLGTSMETINVPGKLSITRDTSFNGNVDISGVLSVKQTVNSVVTNTTINNYNVAVTNDISLNGNLIASGKITAASFASSSDYRIKSNVISLSDCSFEIDALNPVTYHNKITNRDDIGFIAHELQSHIPFLVTGEKDGDAIQTVNYTGIIGLLVHELQQLKKNVVPNSDQTYRGSVQLMNGVAQVNLDNQFNMPDGTFSAFKDVAVFTTNETGWDPVRGVVSGNILTIECMVNTVNAQVSYLVVAKTK